MVLLGLTVAAFGETTLLSDVDMSGVRQGWGCPQADASVMGERLSVNGSTSEYGVGTHASSTWTLPLAGKATSFHARVGVQDAAGRTDKPGSVEFIVRGDSRILYRSGVMRGGNDARSVAVNLSGVTELTLEVTDAGDGIVSDHGNWMDARIEHEGAPLPVLPLVFDPDVPGTPPNRPADVEWDAGAGRLVLRYDGEVLLDGRVVGEELSMQASVRNRRSVEQRLVLRGRNLTLNATVYGSGEAFPAETHGVAQETFPLVRTSHGLSRSLRNNAVYDRKWDWALQAPAGGSTKILPQRESEDRRVFSLSATADSTELVFRPRFYQKHKGIRHFKPWTYRVRKDSITGWSSWWAYREGFNEQQYRAMVAVWGEKRLPEFGYRFLQLDDAYQGGRRIGGAFWTPGTVESWLDWNERFPGGRDEYVRLARSIGAEAGVWTYACFDDKAFVDAHLDWFVTGPDGKPYRAPWAFYGMDATMPRAADTLIRPIYRGFRDSGFTYVKIDGVRHLLYDSLRKNAHYAKAKGRTPAEILRRYFEVIREEVGPETYILACWGVLPEVVGLSDGCRLGGDGYGPLTLQQYNSWNGVVWRNDPDHCDVRPTWSPAEVGNVSTVQAVTASHKDAILRPTLASVAGAVLLLSDRSEVYHDDANLEGVKRASPVLFSVPGQLYDFNPQTTDRLKGVDPDSITSGSGYSPFDAGQFGAVCEWWLNEIDRPFEHWSVLTRMNWTGQPLVATRLNVADLGLDPDREYLVYEFWGKTYLGLCKGSFAVPAAAPKDTRTYAIREKLERPQIVSTSRHISQGGHDLVEVSWDPGEHRLRATSRVVAADSYNIILRTPPAFVVTGAVVDGQSHPVAQDGETATLTVLPVKTGTVDWSVAYRRIP